MIGQIKIRDFTVTFTGPHEYNNNYKCQILSINEKILTTFSRVAKFSYILIQDQTDYNKLKNLALSITNRTFPQQIKFPVIITGFIYNDREHTATWITKQNF